MDGYWPQVSSPYSGTSCGSPYETNESDFTEGSPGQPYSVDSAHSGGSLSPAHSPGFLQEQFRIVPLQKTRLMSHSSVEDEDAWQREVNVSIHLADHAGLVSPFAADPCPAFPDQLLIPQHMSVDDLGREGAVTDHARVVEELVRQGLVTRIKSELLRQMADSASATPYSDATCSKKQAKPGKVKRPMNAFMIFSQKIRHKLVDTFKTAHNAAISQHLGKVWKSLSKDTQEVYKELSATLKELHQAEFPDYKYRPRKNKNKVETKPVMTESGRVSRPKSLARAMDGSAKRPKAASRKSGKKSGKGKTALSCGPSLTMTSVNATVSASLASMLDNRQEQPVTGFRNFVINARAQDGLLKVQESQLVPSPLEVTPPPDSGDQPQLVFDHTAALNPAFRHEDSYTPAQSPQAAQTFLAAPDPPQAARLQLMQLQILQPAFPGPRGSAREYLAVACTADSSAMAATPTQPAESMEFDEPLSEIEPTIPHCGISYDISRYLPVPHLDAVENAVHVFCLDKVKQEPADTLIDSPKDGDFFQDFTIKHVSPEMPAQIFDEGVSDPLFEDGRM